MVSCHKINQVENGPRKTNLLSRKWIGKPHNTQDDMVQEPK